MATTLSWVISAVVIFMVADISIGQYSECFAVNSKHCSKYGFNVTAYPNYLGQMSVQLAETQLETTLTAIEFCTIPRKQAETIGCAIYLPLCMNNRRYPPCQEDCIDVISTCKINQLPGLANALTICGIFPRRATGNCIAQEEEEVTTLAPTV